MTNILSTKEMINCATLGTAKSMKNALSISIAFSIHILFRNENIISEETKTKNTI